MDITYLLNTEDSVIWQEKAKENLDDFRLETTTKHLVVTVINYQIRSSRNIVYCLLLEVLKSELSAA